MYRVLSLTCVIVASILALALITRTPEARATVLVGTITLTVSCATDPERTTITNTTDGPLDLAGFQLASLINRRPGVAPFRLTGTLARGAARIIETGANAPPDAPTHEYIYRDDDPNEGARLGTPYGTLTVLCSAGSGTLPVGGAAPAITPEPTASSRPTMPMPTAVPLPSLPNTGQGGGTGAIPVPGAIAVALQLIVVGWLIGVLRTRVGRRCGRSADSSGGHSGYSALPSDPTAQGREISLADSKVFRPCADPSRSAKSECRNQPR